MMQFSGQWPAIAARAASSPLLATLIAEHAAELATPALIPQRGIASWNLYYFCPQHSVRLIWQRDSPTRHCCPVDGEIFSGEPYDGAWWRELNGRNASACYRLGLLWHLTGNRRYADKVAELLTGYADAYPEYEVHGNIPHNGPGKMNAQTLCEANCILDMALGYDFVAETLSAEQQQHIRQRLLRCAADFLRAHRSPQVHNHEVKINAALAVLGFILGDDQLLDIAVNQTYGLRWQLENGLLEEGLWFEGSIHYHYYALQGFFAFEKLARGTRWSLIDGPWYPKMLNFPLALLLPDGTFPLLNDCLAGQETLQHNDIYEFAWHIWGDLRYAAVLNDTVGGEMTLDALLWRDRPLPAAIPALIPQESLYAPGAGLTLWRRPEQKRVVMIKHSPYGGEHDHYDRLSLLIWQNGRALLPDLGTTGYGARMHYDYYKQSATHNTLSVNQGNQPPANAAILGWHQGEDFQWLDSRVDWRAEPPVLNSHTRVEWDLNAWRDIRFRRRLLWLGEVLIDLSTIENPHRQQLDWTLHLAARALDKSGTAMPFALSGPLQRMREATVSPLANCQPRHFASRDETFALWLAGEAELWQGYGPDNPAIEELSYLVLRSHQPQARFLGVWDFASQMPLTEVSVQHHPQGTQVILRRAGSSTRITIGDEEGKLPDVQHLRQRSPHSSSS
ncbi:alginate lyase [Raoultella sp. BIGb0138]|uniref:heparinase II/III domain-containing protein n=1 Tax=Raoultella sp. BIGb0138 TaxID=2485115 RepID=UPI00104447D7|nr:heparinase II/III family protein [Raoultella sp. BIGb0138]TCW17534.1 alginate lyase [Raoultella sp. BIGb0138]